MKIFNCPNCGSEIFFENTSCGQCGSLLGFDPESFEFSYVKSTTGEIALPNTDLKTYCSNHSFQVCNWLVDHEGDILCKCCSLNRTIPNLSDIDNHEKWRKLEFAKHRLIYQLLVLNLPVYPKLMEGEEGLRFNFVGADNPDGLMTGHANGTVTILLNEADSVEREQLRKRMSEPYRTLIGHFRHEIGHYFWPFLITPMNIARFREFFGDETADYGESLKLHYEKGAPDGWQNSFISSYATTHPWEDWAETWAHYLHIMDTLETAHYSNLGMVRDTGGSAIKFPNPYQLNDFSEIFDRAVELSIVGNSLNRSMGLPDVYPFVIPNAVRAKLEFIHVERAKFAERLL